MNYNLINSQLENQSLKSAFAMRGLERLYAYMEGANFSIDLVEGVPARFAYSIVREVLEDEFEFIAGGCWHIDGCSGYCPGCLQRPWCEFGGNSCWREDEEGR